MRPSRTTTTASAVDPAPVPGSSWPLRMTLTPVAVFMAGLAGERAERLTPFGSVVLRREGCCQRLSAAKRPDGGLSVLLAVSRSRRRRAAARQQTQAGRKDAETQTSEPVTW